MNSLEKRQTIATALQAFAVHPLKEAALTLLATLGYAGDKRIDLTPATAEGFLTAFGQDRPFNQDKAEVQEWRRVEFLFQFTNDEVLSLSSGQLSLMTDQVVNGALIESFVFLAIELAGDVYSRSRLAAITREVNRLFPMPVIVLFRYGPSLSLTVIRRRLHQHDATRDVLEKVTLVKDIAFAEPLRAHLDILHDFSLSALQADFGLHDFVGLHTAWEKRLDTYRLNERFYRDIANWYFWALQHPGLIPPRAVDTEEQCSLFIIRLITRLIFCWFLREKGLIPKDLFRPHMVTEWLKDDSASGGDYYRAILQNLFFATLNQPLEQRGFRSYHQSGGRHGNRGATNLYRYRTALRRPEELLERLKQVPFVNGGLFDCLDQVFRNIENRSNVRLDDFSEELGNRLCLPNELFFGEERDIDLSRVYDDKRRKKEKVRGIIAILSRYKFTIEENTPLEQEIALDPELLGKVFENLLASYNEDTRTTARKATGSFYTPREIVNYMVDEALIAWLEASLVKSGIVLSEKEGESLNVRLHRLFAASASELQNLFSPTETEVLIAAIDRVKILDPACGSGAFPMGALHRLVDLLGKLDPNNRRWKAQQLERARQDRQLAEQMQDEVNRENALREVDARITDIELSFDSRFHALDFARKLYLIENGIYGVDIQPIACQIARLRFFIALIVDQNVDPTAPNYGIRPLPNLDTKIVAADALLPMERLQQHQFDLFDDRIKRLREALELTRHDHFNARTPEKKARCRQRDAELRREIATTLEASGLPGQTAALLSNWSPYDQNAHADFFDPAWMFSIKEGFDVVIGNPPYVRQEQIKHLKPKFKEHYDCYTGTADLYVYFYERGLQLLKPGGTFSFISSNKWFRSAYGEKLRGWLAKNTQLLQLIDFGDAPVFTAIAYPCIVVLRKAGQADGPVASAASPTVRVLNWQPGPPVEQFIEVFCRRSFTLPQSSFKSDGWRLESNVKLKLLERIRAAGMPLGDYCKGRFYYGIKTGLNEAFVIDRQTRDRLIAEHPSSAEIIKPFLRGRDVKRWWVEFADQYLIKIESSENKKHPWSDQSEAEAEKVFAKHYPAIYEHFKPMRQAMIKRYDQGKYFWEIRACTYWQEFEQPKIILGRFMNKPTYAFDDEGYYHNDALYLIAGVSSFLVAVLNSTVSWWFLRHTCTDLQNGYLQALIQNQMPIPIPDTSLIQQHLLEKIINYIDFLITKTYNAVNQIEFFEHLLNGLVYELFFPDELQAQKLTLFKYVEDASLPAIDSILENRRLAVVQETFECLNEPNHPVQECLYSLGSVESVRIIEGKGGTGG